MVVAGGILLDRKEADHAMALGQMVQIASRFVATKECDADESCINIYVKCKERGCADYPEPCRMPEGRFASFYETGREMTDSKEAL